MTEHSQPVAVSTEERLDCCKPGTTKEQKIDVLERLHHIHRRMHAGKAYGFEQTILCDTVREIERLRAELAAMTSSRDAYSDALVKEARRG
jgi:hypothetical protein